MSWGGGGDAGTEAGGCAYAWDGQKKGRWRCRYLVRRGARTMITCDCVELQKCIGIRKHSTSEAIFSPLTPSPLIPSLTCALPQAQVPKTPANSDVSGSDDLTCPPNPKAEQGAPQAPGRRRTGVRRECAATHPCGRSKKRFLFLFSNHMSC